MNHNELKFLKVVIVKLTTLVYFVDSIGLLNGGYGEHAAYNNDKDSEPANVGNEIEKLHYIWYLCALNALLGAVGKEMFMKMKKSKRRAFIKCLAHIKEDLDIPSGAKCITAAMDNTLSDFVYKKHSKVKNKSVDDFQPAYLRMYSTKTAKDSGLKTTIGHWIDSSVTKISSYLSELWDKKQSEFKKLEKRSTDLNKLDIKVMDQAPNLNEPVDNYETLSKSPISVATRMITNVYEAVSGKTVKTASWRQAYSDLLALKKLLDKYKDATRRHYRLLDTILGSSNKYKKELDFSEDMQQFVSKDTPPLLKDLYLFLDKLGQHNGGQPDVKLFSPRVAPIFPDEENSRKLLSPNILPLYEEDPQRNNFTVPAFLKTIGLPKKERNEIIELIMQISGKILGAQNVISETLNRLSNFSTVSDTERLKLTNRIRELDVKLNKTFTLKQKSDVDLKKYTFLSKNQLITIFGETGQHNISNFPFDLDEYDKWTFVEKKKALLNTIRTMAEWGKPQSKTTRKKRQAVTLAPFMFAPALFRLVVLAPVTLSPNVFSPNLFAPLLLTPLILAPQAGSPRVFSPYVLSPFILSPQAISPNVFTPYVLSPNILSPVALTPVVFSPPVLSPNILNPTLLSGPIFSPLVLSPSIKSKAIWGVSLFSPSALS